MKRSGGMRFGFVLCIAAAVEAAAPPENDEKREGAGATVRVADGVTTVAKSPAAGRDTTLLVEPTGSVTLDRVVVSASGGDGIRIDSASGATLTDIESAGNGQAGVRVLRADAAGLFIGGSASSVHDNVSDGIILGDLEAQTGKVVAHIELVSVYGNEVGVRVQQKNEATDSTTTTLNGNMIHDNRGSGLRLRSSFLRRRVFGSVTYMAITGNKIFHNAIGPGCTSAQTAPQIMIQGIVSVTPEEATICSAPLQSDCEAAGAGGHPCYWTGTACTPMWDLRGALDCDDVTASPNQVHSYNTNTDPIGSSELSVGLYASEGANVWADNNSWRTGDESQNVEQDPSSFVDADTLCPVGGVLLQCSDQ